MEKKLNIQQFSSSKLMIAIQRAQRSKRKIRVWKNRAKIYKALSKNKLYLINQNTKNQKRNQNGIYQICVL